MFDSVVDDGALFESAGWVFDCAAMATPPCGDRGEGGGGVECLWWL